MRNAFSRSQRRLGLKGLIAFISVTNMFIPLSTDLYLPALPGMAGHFSATAAEVNMTLTAFFFFFAVGILIFGPFSDKYGRKPLLTFGIALYTAASFLCAAASAIDMLILWRIFQALGAGCVIAVSMAVVKDCFYGRVRETILAVIQAMSMIAPMLAPVVGAFILKFASWHELFVLLGILGALSLAAVCFFQETLRPSGRYKGGFFHSLGRLFVVAKNPAFSSLLAVFSLMTAPYMAFIAVSSYIYIDGFRLSEQAYSAFFAANGIFSILGPILYLKISGHISAKRLAEACFTVSLICGVLLFAVGSVSPWSFFFAFAPFTLIASGIRSFSTSLLLNQQDGDTGSASSLINSVNTFFGSVGMMLGSCGWSDMVFGLAVILTASVALSLFGWLLLSGAKFPMKGLSFKEG